MRCVSKILSLITAVNLCIGSQVYASDELAFHGFDERDILVGVGTFVEKGSRGSVVYKIVISAKGNLAVGEPIHIDFYDNSWTNRARPFPDKAVLVLEPKLDINALFSGSTNRFLSNDYRMPGGDAYRGILPYAGATQLSNVLCNIKDYIVAPTNTWLASHIAVEIARDHLKANPPASEYNKNTRYILGKEPVRVDFGWRVVFEVENGFLGGSLCAVKIGDDKQIKYVSLF